MIIPKQRTMYPFIYKLLDKGYISSYQKIVGNKMRIYYYMEDEGKVYLEEELKKILSTNKYFK